MFNTTSLADLIWLIVGFAGQLLFAMRFLIQWLVSEYQHKSVIPDVFWYFSLGGGTVLLIYAIHKHEPVFILGQAMGLIVYLRNIYFIRRKNNKVYNPGR